MLTASATIEEFAAATAAARPTPGGGAAAALVGALAAALGEMVVNYSVNRKDLAAHQPELTAALGELAAARKLLLGLMAEDQQAYEALSAARKLPPGQQFLAAQRASIEAPQAVAATALSVLELCDKLAGKVNKRLASDLAICAELCVSTVRCSIHTIRAGAAEVTDSTWRRKIDESNQKVVWQAITVIQRFIRKPM